MNRTIVVPVIKSPHSKGRIGREEWQDWYRGIKKAVSVASSIIRQSEGSTEVLVLSNAQYYGQSHEADLYRKALNNFGADGINIRVIKEGYETTEQVARSFELAAEEGKELVFVSTFFHYPRVQWLIWRCKTTVPVKVRHCVAVGIPRPREAITDIILMLLFPLIDIFGGRSFFLKAVNKRRLKGKL